ncbi:MAG: MATE family efflux transporter [Cellulomonadaceae bacterium]|nr:MATE family efflux transporter [Cellulomonadaceae bacterium]
MLPGNGSSLNRDIVGLAVPALGSLVAGPLFVLADTAIVGHVGQAALAGLSLASNLVMLVVGLCVFLVFATTTTVARLSGAGRSAEALRAGVDGMWLAAGLGVVIAVAMFTLAPWATSALGGTGEVAVQSVAYLRAVAPGMPGMLIVLAATGALRGVKNLRAPLVVAAVGAAVNAGLNYVLVFGGEWGIAGSGAGTALVQWGMALWLAVLVARGARRRGVALRPAPAGVWGGMVEGTPLLVRTLSLRAAIILTVVVATRMGDVVLAGHQIVGSVWGFAAFALDALAIAAQALIGHAVGAGRVDDVRSILRRCIMWGIAGGLVLGAVVAGGAGWIAPMFTGSVAVRDAAVAGLVVVGVMMPLGGFVFVLDGVLMGTGDGRFLAGAGLVTVAVYLPVLWGVDAWAAVAQGSGGWGASLRAMMPWGQVADGASFSSATGLAWLWIAFAGIFMAARATTTAHRIRNSAWLASSPHRKV